MPLVVEVEVVWDLRAEEGVSLIPLCLARIDSHGVRVWFSGVRGLGGFE